MRCKNCGWENPDTSATCEKCHSSLSISAPCQASPWKANEIMKGTIAESAVFGQANPIRNMKSCPKCGYPLNEGAVACPNCDHQLVEDAASKKVSATSPEVKKQKSAGATASPHKANRPMTGTVMGGTVSGLTRKHKFCTLRPIAWEGEEVNYNPVTYSGDTIVLNRSNTDANNNSITSREQAILTCEDGEWYIENRSDLRSTFIRVNGRTKLSNGDIIVLGNREFEFKG